jgi:methylmalonyl-CoA mutase N-terminal domain/subunit
VRYQQALDSGEKVIVGLNRFQSQEAEEAHGLFEADPRVEARQKAGLAELKRRRPQGDVERTLKQVEKAIADGENVMPAVLAAVKAYATVGEICGVMRSHWGEYR